MIYMYISTHSEILIIKYLWNLRHIFIWLSQGVVNDYSHRIESSGVNGEVVASMPLERAGPAASPTIVLSKSDLVPRCVASDCHG
jgi:hypothetical protein